MALRLAHQLAEEAARVPVLRSLVTSIFKRRFDRASGQIRRFYGIYPDFEAATRDIPAHRLAGYDNDASALRLADDRCRIFPFDYPVMLWLQKLLPEVSMVFDLGGNVGTSYFGYRKYLQYPDRLHWLVSEVAAVAALGTKVAEEAGATQLRFTTELTRLPEADVFLAAGSLHFIPGPFKLLRSVSTLPKHLLINKVPAYDLPSAVTLENMGSAFNPYQLFNRAEFVGEFESMGYQIADQWCSPDLSCEIPLFPEHSIRGYTGFYFRRGNA